MQNQHHWILVPTPLDLAPTPLDYALVQPQSLPVPDSMFWCASCLPSPCTPTHKGGDLRPPPQRGGARPSAARPPLWNLLRGPWGARGLRPTARVFNHLLASQRTTRVSTNHWGLNPPRGLQPTTRASTNNQGFNSKQANHQTNLSSMLSWSSH